MTFIVLLAALAWSAPALGPEDLERAQAGEVVVKLDDDGTSYVGAVQIAAPPERVLAAILDFDHAVAESSLLRAAEVYARSDNSVAVKFEAGIMGFTGTWHAIYTWDGAQRCSYTLDTTRENSIEKMTGEYVLTPKDGGTLLTVSAESVPGGAYPAWLVRSAGRGSTEQTLERLRARSAP